MSGLMSDGSTPTNVSMAVGSQEICTNCKTEAPTIFVSVRKSWAFLVKTTTKFRLSNRRYIAWLCMICLRKFMHDAGWFGDGGFVSQVVPAEDEQELELLLVKAEIEYAADGSSVVTLVEKE